MDIPDDKQGLSRAVPAKPGKSDASGASREREARLAAALRANLRRRKAPPGSGD